MFTLLAMYFGLGILSVIISLPLIFEKIKPNYLYGFRIKATLEDPTVWYAVNKYFAKRFLFVGVTEIIASMVLYLIPGITIDGYAIAVLAVFVIAFSIAMSQSLKYIKTIQAGQDR
jgi:hypothetical protein